MSFHQQDFKKRFTTMGDEAESVFLELFPNAHRLGLNRPKFGMKKMPLNMRQTPDYMLNDRIVECMGVGRDGILKFKDDKSSALTAWETIGPVWLFVWNSHKRQYTYDTFQAWAGQLGIHGIASTFENDGKTYLGLGVDNFPSDPIPYEPLHLAA